MHYCHPTKKRRRRRIQGFGDVEHKTQLPIFYINSPKELAPDLTISKDYKYSSLSCHFDPSSFVTNIAFFFTHLDNCLHLALGTFLLHSQCRHSPFHRTPLCCVVTLTESKSTYISDILVSIIHTMDPNVGSGAEAKMLGNISLS